VKVSEKSGEVEPSILDDRGSDRVFASIPATLEAYVATRTDDAARTVEKLVHRCARTGLWHVVTAPLAASIGMIPCRFGASLMLRRSDGLLSAAIVAGNWSITLLGDEAWIDVVSPRASALAIIGKPVRTRIEIPFLSPTLRVFGSTQIGNYQRFHCH
jgi:hypothetical protein